MLRVPNNIRDPYDRQSITAQLERTMLAAAALLEPSEL
jgi:hypothetical protein